MLSLVRGQKYSRPDIKEMAGLSRRAKGGNWDTGIVEHNGEFLIFANGGMKKFHEAVERAAEQAKSDIRRYARSQRGRRVTVYPPDWMEKPLRAILGEE